jgi:O-antigen/teichoic acid export membrane protein
VLVGVPKVVNGAASFFIRLYTTRFLDPAAYGAFSLGVNALMLYDGLINAALDIGTLSRLGEGSTPAQAQPAEKANLGLKMAAGGALFGLFALAGEWAGRHFLHGQGGRGFFLALATAGTGIMALRSAQLYFQARLRFRLYGALDLAHSVLRVGLVGLALWLGAKTADPLMWALAAAPALIFAGMALAAGAWGAWGGAAAWRREARQVLARSGPILASFGTSTLVSKMDVFLLALLSTPEELGLYGAALTMAIVPEMIGSYPGPVFLPRIMPALEAGTFPAMYRKVNGLTLAAAGGALALALAAGRPVMELLLPDKYGQSIGLVLILLPGMLATASCSPLTQNFLMLKKPKTFVVADAVAAPVLLGLYWWLAPAHGAVAAAWITSGHRVAKAAVVHGVAYRLVRGRH